MKTISDYTIYCTPRQTKKALKLGASLKTFIHVEPEFSMANGCLPYPEEIEMYEYPTAEQMIGWIEQNTLFECIQVSVDAKPTNWMYANYYGKDNCISLDRFSSRKEATLAAIDAALEYLTNKN